MSQHGNLNTESASEVIKMLKDIAKDKLIIMVTHNIEQVEEHATRIIKMQDGQIMEDRRVKEIKEEIVEENEKELKNHKYSLANTYKLGFRNTFNIASKFLLLFLVFLFIIVSIFAEYTIFQTKETEASQRYARGTFNDLSDNRILIKKQDKTAFEEEDYKRIEENDNIDYIIRNDYILDGYVTLYDRKAKGYFMNTDIVVYDCDISISGYAYLVEEFEGDLNIGRMPENENEVVVKINLENPNIKVKNSLNEILDIPLEIGISRASDIDGEYKEPVKAKIVGIQYARR